MPRKSMPAGMPSQGFASNVNVKNQFSKVLSNPFGEARFGVKYNNTRNSSAS